MRLFWLKHSALWLAVACGIGVFAAAPEAYGEKQKRSQKAKPSRAKKMPAAGPDCFQGLLNMAYLQGEAASYETVVAGIDAEMAALANRVAALKQQKERLMPWLSSRTAKAEALHTMQSQQCQWGCSEYEVLAGQLEGVAQVSEGLLRQVRSELGLLEGQALQLEGRLGRALKHKKELDCSPAKGHIEACSKVLVEWVQISRELARLHTMFIDHKRRFEESDMALQRVIRSGKEHANVMQVSCSHSPRVRVLQAFANQEGPIGAVGQTIRSLETLLQALSTRYLDLAGP